LPSGTLHDISTGDGDARRYIHPPTSDALLELGQLHMRLCNSDSWSNIDYSKVLCLLAACVREDAYWLTIVAFDEVFENPRCHMPPWIHGYNFILVGPLRKGTNAHSRFGVAEVGSTGVRKFVRTSKYLAKSHL